jgi:hypothetical protein
VRLFCSTLFLALISLTLCAQTQTPPPPGPQGSRPVLSPPGQATFAFADGKQISIDYSRPSIRGRKIMGGLVPYGKVWRTGANPATTFVTQADLDLAGARVPAGKYTLYTVPGEDTWTIIINRQTGQWGTVYNQDQDLVRVNVKPVHLSETVDEFTISFVNRAPKAGTLKLEWENTSVPVPFSEAGAK